MEKNVKIIEPVVCKAEKTDASAKRVCAYTRVSTATDKQEKSFASQAEYYTSLIQKEPESVSYTHLSARGSVSFRLEI